LLLMVLLYLLLLRRCPLEHHLSMLLLGLLLEMGILLNLLLLLRVACLQLGLKLSSSYVFAVVLEW
jgi:hypothetical protein